jgi:hypothetical protein
MSYPRNAASPERVSIGAVVQISDGAVQTSGVSVTIIPFGGTETAAANSPAYSSAGCVLYTPSQAETNYTSFVLIASKSGCWPASVTVITGANPTAGLVQVGGYASGQAPLQPLVAGRQIAVSATTGKVTAEAVELDSATQTQITEIKVKTDNLPSDPADQSLVIAATDAVMARLGAPAGASMSADIAAVKTETASLLSRLTANAATAIQNLFHMITGTGASSKYTVAALENAPAGGGGGGDAEQDTLLEVQTTVEALALSLAGASVTVTSRVSGSEITAYIGDDYKVRSGTELEITVSDTGGALHTKLAAIGTSNLYFGASLPRKDPGQITGTISSLSYASNVLTIAVEITACASGLTTGDYTYQIQSSQAQGGDFDDYVELEGTLVVKQRTVAVRG